MIKTLFLDWDGTMTDGRVFILQTGEQLCAYNAKDGMAIRLATYAGLRIFVLTGNRLNDGLRAWLFGIGIEAIVDGVRDKASLVREIAQMRKLDLGDAAFMGDDLNDLEAMAIVRFAAAPADAHPEVQEKADFVARARGGDGAVKELIEFLRTWGEAALPKKKGERE